MERTLISWSLPNWITIMIMAAAGYAVLGVVAQLLKNQGIGVASSGVGQY